MSGPEIDTFSFTHEGTNFNLVKGGQSSHSVTLNGVQYAVLGDKEKLDAACKVLNSIPLDFLSSTEDLHGRLSQHGDISYPMQEKADAVSIKTLHNQTTQDPQKTAQTLKIAQAIEDARKISGKPAYINKMRTAARDSLDVGDIHTARLIVSEAFQGIKGGFGLVQALRFVEGISKDDRWDLRNKGPLIDLSQEELHKAAKDQELQARDLFQQEEWDPAEMLDSIFLYHQAGDTQKVGDLFQEMITLCEKDTNTEALGEVLKNLTKLINRQPSDHFEEAVQLANRFSSIIPDIQHEEQKPLLERAVRETLKQAITPSLINEQIEQANILLEQAKEQQLQGNMNGAIDIRNSASDICRQAGQVELATSIADESLALVLEHGVSEKQTATFQAVVNARGYQVDLNVAPLIPPLAGNAINQEKAHAWIEAHPPECRPALEAAVANTRHVSFEDFQKELQKTVASFNETLKALPPDKQDYVILVESGKSNLWVAELSLSHLERLPTDVVDLNNFNKYLDNHPKTTRVLFLDDGIYSGTQMRGHVNVNKGAFESHGINDYTIHVAAPFMTEHGKNRIQSAGKDHLQIASHSTMKTIEDVIQEPQHRQMLNEMYSLEGSGGLKSRTLTYFDHKIPDYLSTLAVYETGAVMNAQGMALTKPHPHEAEVLCMPFVPKTISPYKAGFKELHGIT